MNWEMCVLLESKSLYVFVFLKFMDDLLKN